MFSCGTEFYTHDMYINVNLHCGKSVESSYYKCNVGPLICYNCASEITDPEILAVVGRLSGKFQMVYPSCNVGCPPHVTKRQRKTIQPIAVRKRKRVEKKNAVKRAAKKSRGMNQGDRSTASINALSQGIPKLTQSTLRDGTWLASRKGLWRQIKMAREE